MRAAFGQTFDVPLGYLNTAAIGVPPTIVADAVEQSVQRWRGGLDTAPGFDVHVAGARDGFARLIGVEPSRVAIGTSVSQLIGLVAASVPDGTRVLVPGGDFTSVSFPFAAQAGRGVRIDEGPVDRMGDYDLLAVSLVQSANGAMIDLDAVRDQAAATGTKVLLDVTQTAGWTPLSLGWADWVVGSSYKWLMSPRGAAWMSISSAELDRTVPHSANWYAGESPWTSIYGLPLRLAADARRLDLSPAWFSQVGAAVAMPWLASLDLAAVREHCVGLANSLLAKLGLPETTAPIVSLAVPPDRLTEAGVRFSLRDGHVRLAFALYNTDEDVDLVVDALSR